LSQPHHIIGAPDLRRERAVRQKKSCLSCRKAMMNKKIFNPADIAKYPNCQNGDLAKVAKQSSPSEESEEQKEVLPTFPETIYPLLPDFLRQITNYANSGEDADLLLLGSLVVISACLPNVYGIYGGVTVFPNLFLFVTAQASAGKGRISLCRRLVEPIHRRLRETNKPEYGEYKRQQAEYVANKKNPDAENGLFSRFIFYFMNVRLVWNDVFANDGADTLDTTFCRIGEQFYDLYKILQTSSPIRFCFSKPRQDEFNAFFDGIQKQYAALFGLDIVASVRRLGLITYRIAMILTTLRICDDGNISTTMVCNDADFRTALAMVNVLLQHTAKVFQTLPQQNPQSASDNEPELLRRQFLDALPPPSSTGKPTSALLKNWASLPKRPKDIFPISAKMASYPSKIR
jgi:hypothetical protein